MFFRTPEEERVRSLPAAWTDIEGVDPFLVVSAGRAHFRVEDLLALAGFVRRLEGKEA